MSPTPSPTSPLPSFQDGSIDAILGHAARATLPYKRANRDEGHATAFWFNELIPSEGAAGDGAATDGEVVRRYLVTAAEPTRVDLAEITLRPELCDPAPSAERLVMTGFADGWTPLPGLGVAVLPASVLHTYADRKGWSWSTDEITDGVAARAEDLAGIGADPVRAYVLGHDTGEGGEREQAVVVGVLVRARDGSIRWGGELPQGCVGAPVFTSVILKKNQFRLVCAGVALPADGRSPGHHPVATFDRIRTALNPDAHPETAEGGSTRRWWRRRAR
ncbi:hypothetical protein [Streptomyces cacaoi]|uniref:hypothetical protein n=1 Tax=Streptomyces cacaoi TaxID=1898 RepID=UPI00374A5A2B